MGLSAADRLTNCQGRRAINHRTTTGHWEPTDSEGAANVAGSKFHRSLPWLR